MQQAVGKCTSTQHLSAVHENLLEGARSKQARVHVRGEAQLGQGERERKHACIRERLSP